MGQGTMATMQLKTGRTGAKGLKAAGNAGRTPEVQIEMGGEAAGGERLCKQPRAPA